MSTRKHEIPILRVPFSDEDHAFISTGISEVLSSGMLSMGPKTTSFEDEFGHWVGVDHCIATSNGTSALELILRALDVTDRPVIVPTNTFLATALAVLHSGGRVVFVDSDPETLCIDPDDLEKRITPEVGAVVLVHIGGVITPAIDRIEAVCRRNDVPLVEDCAHAHGCSFAGRTAGTIGVAGAFSFFPTKVLTTGEGGIVTTNDEALAARARIVRNQGKSPEHGNHIAYPGHNFRMSEITAVIGLQQMRRAEQLIQQRRHIAGRYDELLQDQELVRPLRLSEGAVSSYYKYVAYIPEDVDRGELKRRMREEHGVSLTGEVYADPCHSEPIWQDFTYCGKPRTSEGCGLAPGCGCNERQHGYPGAERLSKHHICLPLYPGLTDGDVEYVADKLVTIVRELKETA